MGDAVEEFEAGLTFARGSGYSFRGAKHEVKLVEEKDLDSPYGPGYDMNTHYLCLALQEGLVLSTRHVNHGLWTTVKTGGGWNISLKLLRLDCVVLRKGEVE
jgi:hypothetical protein